MGKGDRRAAKRQAKKAMPKLAATPKRKNRGRARMAEVTGEREGEIKATVLSARARHMGLSSAHATEMERQRLSEGAGMALDLLCDPDEASRLWGHYVAITAAEARYHRSMGNSIHAKTAKIEMMQERFETRADDRPDLRSEEDRDRDAVNAWMRWQGAIGRLDARDQAAIFNAYRREAELVSAGRVTPAGSRFVQAMLNMDSRME